LFYLKGSVDLRNTVWAGMSECSRQIKPWLGESDIQF